MTTITEPGIYPNTSMDDYRAIKAINSSALKYARLSMAHVKAALDGVLAFSSDATDFGNLVHTLVLEPDLYGERYIIEPGPENFRTAKGEIAKNFRSTKDYEKWCEAQTKLVISQADYDRAKRCAEAVANDRRASQMLAGGKKECVIVWVDPKTGVLCKARLDHHSDEWIADLKSTMDAGRRFEQQISKLDYVLSGAFYRRGAAALDGVVRPFGLVAVDTSEVVGVRAAPLCKLDLDLADIRIDHYLDKVRTCQLSDVWPGYESPEEWKAAEWVNRFDGMPDDLTTPETAGVW